MHAIAGSGGLLWCLPLGADVAEISHNATISVSDRDLVRVAQYAAIQSDPNAPKEDVVEILRAAGPPKYSQPPQFGNAVNRTAFSPVFRSRSSSRRITTTSCAGFQMEIERRAPRDLPLAGRSAARGMVFEKEPGYKPTPANPLVFHFHGALDVSESLVLTEDDYLTFLANIAAKPDLLPDVVQQAFAATSFLFIGYRLGDWNFRVIFQTLRARQQFSSIVVLKPPDETDPNRAAHQAYFEKYYGALDMKIFWGTAREFSSQLEERWALERTKK